MKITYIQSPPNMTHDSLNWQSLKQSILAHKSDVLITNEMPFGKWLPSSPQYNEQDAQQWIIESDKGLVELQQLDIALVLSSRAIKAADKLANEAFVLDAGGYQFAHQKHYFPEESGFYETAWFTTEKPGFNVVKTPKITVGFMLCTELMFNEWARAYGRQGAHLIAIPRATGQNYDNWKTAASMAAIVSGCYVVSSNRAGEHDDELTFGGKGFAFAPDGSQISETTNENPVVSFELDFTQVASAQAQYPCYVKEFSF